jgi:hypothetical protein
MNSHDRISNKPGYPKKVNDLVVYHRQVHRYMSNQIYQNYMYAKEIIKGSDEDEMATLELIGEHIYIIL